MNIAVTDAEQIERRNLVEKGDLYRTIAGAASPRGTLILRGLSGGNSSAPSTTSSFFDDIPLNWSELYDVSSVEVLRGPQGTLYGSNAIGGTVRVLTNQPNLSEFEVFGSAQMKWEKYDSGINNRTYIGANLPLIENQLALRVVGHSSYDPGRVYNAGTGQYDTDDRRYVRAKLLWQPRSDMSFALGYIHNRTHSRGTETLDRSQPGRYRQANLTEDASLPGGYDVSFEYIPCEGERAQCRGEGPKGDHPTRYTVWSPMDPWSKAEQNIYTFNFDMDNIGGIADLIYAGSYRQTTGSSMDTAWTRLDAQDMFKTWILNDNGGYSRWTHEVRLQSSNFSAFDWTVGYFYDRSENDPNPNRQFQYHETTQEARSIANAFWGWGLGAWGGDVFQLGETLYGDRSKNYNLNAQGSFDEEQAFFGQVGYTFNLDTLGELELTAGIRAYELKDESKSTSTGIWIGPTPNVSESSGEESGNRKKFTVSWRPRDEFAFYGVYSEGYRPGGNNFPVLPASCAADPNASSFTSRYNSDEIKNYELGFKGYLFNNRLQVSSAVYQIDWSGVWASIYMPTCGFSYTANAASAESKGIELETETLIAEDLRLIFNAGYTDSQMTSDAEAIGAEAGDDMTMVPEYNIYLALEKELNVFGRDGFVRADVASYGEYITHFNTREEDRTPAYSVVNVSAGVDVNENTRLSFYVNNLLDEEYTTYRRARSRSASSWNSAYYEDYGAQRNFTVRLDVKF